jgi:hypothetical protein
MVELIVTNGLDATIWAIFNNDNPMSASIQGLCRSIKSEHPDLKIYILVSPLGIVVGNFFF